MVVTLTDFRHNLTKLLEISAKKEIYITRNGKKIAVVYGIADDDKNITNMVIFPSSE